MAFISYFIYGYMLLLIYEILTEERHCNWKYCFVLLVGLSKYIAERGNYTQYVAPFVLCTLLILYSICIHSKNSNLLNFKYALLSYGIHYAINVVTGCVYGIIAGLAEINANDWGYYILSIGRILIVVILIKGKNVLLKLKQGWIIYICVIATIVLMFTEQFLRVYYSTRYKSYGYMAVACTYVAVLFTTLWLLDHYKMAKIQKMYADDNQQMSQKLHRSKEILPMIANYVSTMDGTPDEGMRKKLEEVCHDYGKELGGTQMCAEFIETTGIDLVDLLLRTKIIECGEQDIELNVFVSTQIAEDMKRMDISDGEITRLMGDLLRNSINAVSKLQNKMILLLIARDENDCVLIRIYDSGIPFPPYVLERFGERGNTTWGTGNGIADMMETLRRVHASIEINMDMDAGDVFTKGIFICFDGEDNVNITQRKEYPGDAEGRVCF